MRRPRYSDPDTATRVAVWDLLDKFDYPDERGLGGSPFIGGGGGAMAHVLIVSDSEQISVQNKADFIVTQTNSSSQLQAIFDTLSGPISIWMAGQFELDDDVTAPSGSWIRGLGYQSVGGSS